MADTIVAPQTTSSTTGTTTGTTNHVQNLLSHIRSTGDAIDRGDVLGSAMGVTNVAMDIIGLAGDPMGAISSAGVGWVLNAVSFLREPFDILLGNPSAITGSAQSWMTAARNLSQTAQQYRQASVTQTGSWRGSAGDGYRTASANQAAGLEALARASQAVSSAMTRAGQAVAQARKVVLDLINDAVRKIIQICIEALSKSWLSFGASIAMGIAQSVQKAVSTAQKLLKQIKDVVQTLQQIIKTVQQIVQAVKQIKQLLQQIGGRATGQQPVTPQGQAVPYDSDLYRTNMAGVHAGPDLVTPTPAGGPQVSAVPQLSNVADTHDHGPTSQNGWPVNPPRSSRTIPGTNVRVVVADGPAGDVLIYVLGQVNSRVEDISMNSERGERDDWGYAERNVRGSSNVISNHASGTAVDINATRHALGATGTFTPAQVQEIHRILAEVDNVVRWGGDYTGRRDEMHFEINGSQEQVAAVAARLRAAQQAP